MDNVTDFRWLSHRKLLRSPLCGMIGMLRYRPGPGSGFKVQGSGFGGWGLGCRARRSRRSGVREGSGFRVLGSGFRVQGSGFRGGQSRGRTLASLTPPPVPFAAVLCNH
jgi:hypothetical protein